MRIVFASHTSQTGVFRVGSHHLARELALMGHDVTHVSTPISASHVAKIRSADVRARFAVATQRPKVDSAGVKHAIPLIGVPLPTLPASLARLEIQHPMRPWTTLIGPDRPDVLFVDQPLFSEAIEIIDPRVLIYRPTDAHFGRALRQAEVNVIARAHGVVATSRVVLDEVMKGGAQVLPTLILENGVEFDRFATTVSSNVREKGVAYLGALDKRFGWDSLMAMARAFPEVPFRIAGPMPADRPADLTSNIDLLGAVPYEQAASFLNGSTVGVLPFSTDPGNQGRSPMKYYEYLAAGLSVVASDSPTLRERGASQVWLYSTPRDAVHALASALEAPSPNIEGRRYAASYSWAARAEALTGFAAGLLSDYRGHHG